MLKMNLFPHAALPQTQTTPRRSPQKKKITLKKKMIADIIGLNNVNAELTI